tara:strand:+ start:656 stop:1540 length:885 start_codon:yes stop_codon:yes gene_type:complete
MAKKTDKKELGIVLIAHGLPMYGFYAFNLAVGLKRVSPTIPITVITSGGAFSQLEKLEIDSVIDNMIVSNPEWTNTKTGYDVFYNKLCLDLCTPYEKTLYLDVDQAWIPRRPVEDLLSIVEGNPFVPITFKEIDCATYERVNGDWMDYKQLKEFYGVDKCYTISSEIMYFESGTEVFKNARKVYNDNKIDRKKFGDGHADEPFITAGMAMSKVQPPFTPFVPSYWQGRDYKKIPKDESVYQEYFTVSIGGNWNARNAERMYNAITGANYYEIGVSRPLYKAQHKKLAVKSRQVL